MPRVAKIVHNYGITVSKVKELEFLVTTSQRMLQGGIAWFDSPNVLDVVKAYIYRGETLISTLHGLDVAETGQKGGLISPNNEFRLDNSYDSPVRLEEGDKLVVQGISYDIDKIFYCCLNWGD